MTKIEREQIHLELKNRIKNEFKAIMQKLGIDKKTEAMRYCIHQTWKQMYGEENP